MATEGKQTHVEVHFRIPKEQADRLKDVARAKDRSLSWLIKDILNKYLEILTTLALLFL